MRGAKLLPLLSLVCLGLTPVPAQAGCTSGDYSTCPGASLYTPSNGATGINPDSAYHGWGTATYATAYQLWVGSAPGNNNYYDSGIGTFTSQSVTGLPGSTTMWATLRTRYPDGSWKSTGPGALVSYTTSGGATGACVLPWGGSIANGASVQAFPSSSVTYPATCTPSTRTCTNGTLSGSGAYPSCTVTYQGGQISRVWANTIAYSTTDTITWSAGTGAASYRLTIGSSVGASNYRDSGVLVGVTSYTYPSSVLPLDTYVYARLTTTFPNSVTTTSDNMFKMATQPAGSCTLPWGGTLPSGGSVTAYQSATVPPGSECLGQTRTCTNGSLSGSYLYQSCSPPQACGW